ncbi:MAG: malonyl-CoA decarboxylase [Neisseriaceae bacterium]|nr:malonyl-CoA decarboxylase [Neisseriaceae bacterium]MBP6861228.1 malonyl-CoA decarboxylase [Neisseriaceae bacterium]
MSNATVSLFDKALKSWLPKSWRGQEGAAVPSAASTLSPNLDGKDMDTLRQWIDSCLAKDGCQVTARTRAATLGTHFLNLSDLGRLRFLRLLAENDYGVEEDKVQAAILAWQQCTANGACVEPENKVTAEQALRQALEPRRIKLLKQFNGLQSGVKFLVDLRAEVLRLLKKHPELAPLEVDLKSLLSSWFDIGLLQLEQIGWHSSAETLEKLIVYEAVHTIKSWNDLKNRLDSDRRCFAFFHPSMPKEPLIFVEVALVNGIADSVQKLLDEEAPLEDLSKADTAIFYSISNAQMGLAGISFGNFLIKQVVQQLREEFATLKYFATLSPIPGFNRWLSQQAPEALMALPGGKEWLALLDAEGAGAGKASKAKPKKVAKGEDPKKEALLRLVAHYLGVEKRGGKTAKDPVAHFHLSNGAQLFQINWQADTSDKGKKEAASMMVNYLYELPKIEARSQQYSERGSIALSRKVQKLIK